MEDPRTMDGLQSLYDADFYAWTQEQAALLGRGDLGVVDVANIREEIETLGRKEVAELRSRLRVLAAHLLKLMVQPDKATRSWTTTILYQRVAIADHIKDNPSLKSKLAETFEAAYEGAREFASEETGLSLKSFPAQPPFSCAEAISRDWMPRAMPSQPDRPMA